MPGATSHISSGVSEEQQVYGVFIRFARRLIFDSLPGCQMFSILSSSLDL